jgi:hypothetical protein
MRKLLSNGLVFVAGIVSLPIASTHADSTKPAEHRKQNDSRLASLRAFFNKSHSPASSLSPAFLEAADTYGLDWRLLPSISFIESTGGKSAKNNNLFGWDSGRAAFTSGLACIRSVAFSLATSKLYRHKDVDGILKTYNANADYAGKVKSVMRNIAATQQAD